MTKQQGTNANYTGKGLEEFIENRLIRLGYKFVHKKQFKVAIYMDQPLYTKQFYVGRSIYNTYWYCDFIIYHPQKWEKCLIIESKWQQSKGSVDEKFPYLVENLKKHDYYQSIIILDGGGYKAGAEKWLKSQTNDTFLSVFNMMEFQKWANNGNL